MNKDKIIKYVNGEASVEEMEAVLAWISTSELNKAYVYKLRDSITISQMESVGTKYEEFAEPKREVMENIKLHMSLKYNRDRRKYLILFRSSAAIILLLLLLNICQFIVKEPTLSVKPYRYQSNNIIRTYFTENGVKGKILLADGTIVWLNSGSSISYPDKFEDDARRVKIIGEGYFDIVKNPEWPMEISTCKGTVLEVLGTRLNIRSYEDEKEITTLFSGKVNIITKDKVLEIKPLETVIIEDAPKKISNNIVVLNNNVDTTKVIAWKSGKLIFERQPLGEIVRELERWHGVEIIVEDNSILDYKITASFSNESIIQIMEMIAFTTPVKYYLKDNTLHITKRKI